MTTPHHENIEQELRPRCEFRASESLKQRIQNAGATPNVRASSHRRKFLRFLPTGIAATALLALGLFLTLPSQHHVHAAKPLFIQAAEEFNKAPSFSAIVKVRTTAKENFSYIDMKQNLMTHALIVSPSTGKWMLRKAGRVALCDGQYIWHWLPQEGYGWKMNRTDTDILDIFALFLNPAQIFKNEDGITNAWVIQSEGVIILQSETPTPLHFHNDFNKETSISTTDTKREYVIEKESNKLLKMKISTANNDQTILEMTDINYSYRPTEADFSLPEGITWTDRTQEARQKKLDEKAIKEFTDITPEEAVKKMFNAFNRWEVEKLTGILPEDDAKVIESTYGLYRGCTLLKTGKAFQSGDYKGLFVPVTLKMANGETIKRTVSMRNDTPSHHWRNDGGL